MLGVSVELWIKATISYSFSVESPPRGRWDGGGSHVRVFEDKKARPFYLFKALLFIRVLFVRQQQNYRSGIENKSLFLYKKKNESKENEIHTIQMTVQSISLPRGVRKKNLLSLFNHENVIYIFFYISELYHKI